MKYLVCGYYGFKNLGDELILAKIIEDLQDIDPKAEITVCSGDVSYTNKVHAVNGIDRLSPSALSDAVQNSEVVIVGGGGLIQEYNDIRAEDLFTSFGYGIASYSIAPLLANIFDKPVFYWAHGVGPVFSEAGMKFARWFYGLSDFTTIRDRESYDLLMRLAPDLKNVVTDTDPVMALDVKKFTRTSSTSLPDNRIKLGFNIRPWFGIDKALTAISGALNQLCSNNNNILIVPIPFDLALDHAPIKSVVSSLPKSSVFDYDFEAIDSPREGLLYLNELDCFVGMRLHSIIVSRLMKKPSLCISYDQKTDSFASSLEIPALRIEALTKESLISCLNSLLSSRGRQIADLKVEYKTPEIFSKFIAGERALLHGQREVSSQSPEHSERDKREFAAYEDFIQGLKAEVENLGKTNEHLLSEKNQLNEQRIYIQGVLDNIYASDFWRVASCLYRMRDNSIVLKNIYRSLKWLKAKNNPLPVHVSKFTAYIKRHRVRGAFGKLFNMAYRVIYDIMRGVLPPGLKNMLRRFLIRENISPAKSLYEIHQELQHDYYLRYDEAPNTDEMDKINKLLSANQYKGIILYPLSYPLHIKQRPEHILRALASRGYLCIITTYEPVNGEIECLGHNLYITNLLGAVYSSLRNREVILYVTYCFFMYLCGLYKNHKLIYDTLDEISLTSQYGPKTEMDHTYMLNHAALSLFSSSRLFNSYRSVARNPLLMENAVSVKDFRIGEMEYDVSKFEKGNSVAIGYYGCISDLLDYDVLESLLKIERVLLLVIGPICPFDASHKEQLDTDFARLKKYDNFLYIDFIEYENLKYYLKDFDINIIPFKVNKITDSVSPLKLFEYMTNGRPIICTPTRELLKFKDRIFIEEPKNFDKTVRKIIKEHITYVDYGDIIQNHDWEQHARTIENWLGVLDVFPLSPLSTSKVVDILNVNFFDWDGKTVYRGGAERYVLDLCKILKQLDYEPRILQNANFAFERTYEDIKVIGLPAGSNTNVDVLFRYYLNNFAHSDRVICSPLDIACLSTSVKALGINHGMHWDGVTNSLSLHNEARYDIIFNALHTVEKCICVDTNFINWVRTYDYALARKLVYVPNYYDSDQFKPSEKNFANDEIIITYPRRLYAARGFYLVLEAIDRILPSYLNVQFHFVGQVSPPDDADIEKYTHKYPGRVLHYSFDMPEMHKAYEISQIVLIPTVQSEGTSLSCIEAMATNNAIISTDIGGLPNLIIDGFNGLLISPDANELTKAILRLIENRQERIMLARNALQAAPSFSKAKWEARWRKIFADFINK